MRHDATSATSVNEEVDPVSVSFRDSGYSAAAEFAREFGLEAT
jgi:hypothetical protein